MKESMPSPDKVLFRPPVKLVNVSEMNSVRLTEEQKQEKQRLLK
jgi:hypothetical protein